MCIFVGYYFVWKKCQLVPVHKITRVEKARKIDFDEIKIGVFNHTGRVSGQASFQGEDQLNEGVKASSCGPKLSAGTNASSSESGWSARTEAQRSRSGGGPRLRRAGPEEERLREAVRRRTWAHSSGREQRLGGAGSEGRLSSWFLGLR